MNEKVKIVLLGDSITQGIGSRQINYEKTEPKKKAH